MFLKPASFILSLSIIATFTACQQVDNDQNMEKKTIATDNPDSLDDKNTYLNPVDSNIYFTEGEWETYAPEVPKINKGIVQTKQIILLLDDAQMEARISIDTLAEFIKVAEEIIYTEFEDSDKVGELLIQFTLHETGIPGVAISLTDDVDRDKTSEINNKLKAIRGFETKKDSVPFQLHIGINQ
ncbi:MAG: hypothetical protein GQ574_11990 [Crocinitomix sp.]|nr:hypothetical protein [Crocinitomix sp.]